jgi:hypothetical protein
MQHEITQAVVMLLDVLFICLVEFHLKVSRVLVVVFVPLIRIYNPCKIMALPCLLSGWPELSPTSSDSISLIAYRVLGLVFFPLQDQHMEC